MRAVRLLALALSIAFALVGAGADTLCAQSSERQERSPNRIVHHFDFDERKAGNLETIPKYWDPLRPAGFPGFAKGEFDFTVGRTAPPSFYLKSEGRDVAYNYTGPGTAVRRGAEYRLEGFIRPHRLEHARACLSACFLDRHGKRLLETLVRTPYVGGPDQADEWALVELQLPPTPVEASTIAIAGWILQASTWDDALRLRRHIARVDVHGGAWFDDITVYRLPHVELTTGAPGNVISPDDSPGLRILVTEQSNSKLTGGLTVFTASGEAVETHPISIVCDGAESVMRIPLNRLPAGLYTTRLELTGHGMPVVTRTLDFVILDPLAGDSGGLARPFGIVIDPTARTDPQTEFNLLQHQGARSVKLPVWPSSHGEPGDRTWRRAADDMLQGLLKYGFVMTGVLYGPPEAIARRYGAYTRSVVDLLGDDPDAWQEHLAAEAAPRAGVYRWWQIGPDGVSMSVPEKLTKAANQLRDALRPYMLLPRLGATALTSDERDTGKMSVEQLTLAIGREVETGQLNETFRQLDTLGYDQVSAYVVPLPQERYARIPRLADWAQRILAARHAGADTVFVPQTWHVRETEQGPVTEPTEEFIILRTIADMLNYADPGPRVRIGDSGVHCLAFHFSTTTVLAMWDESAPPEGSRHAIQLGRAARQVDLWGQSSSLERDPHGRQIVRLSPMPVLIDNVERWLIDFRTSLVLTPRHVEAGTELVRHTIESTYKSSTPVTGSCLLAVPPSWEVAPRSFDIRLLPGRTLSIPIDVRYSHREPAGLKDLIAKLALEQGQYYLEVPLSVELGLTDVDVWGMAFVEGDDLVLRHIVSNHTDTGIHFRGSAAVPGRERQYRPLSGLRPGDTQSVEYRFRRGAELTGRHIILGLREMNDGPRMHNLELIVP